MATHILRNNEDGEKGGWDVLPLKVFVIRKTEPRSCFYKIYIFGGLSPFYETGAIFTVFRNLLSVLNKSLCTAG